MEPIISVSSLSKSYTVYKKSPGFFGSISSFFVRHTQVVKAVDTLSFTIEEGELVGFIGPNGAGKTTTLKCLSGLLYPTSGGVSVLGYTPFERKKAFLKQISLVMGQKTNLWWDLPAMDTFLLYKEIYEVAQKQFSQTLDELVHLLDVKKLLTTQVRKLSLGERMRMELIAALIYQPKILFLDEPTIGLDVVMQKKLRDFVKTYNQTHTATILLTSHYMEDVKQLAKRVIIIDHGHIMYDGDINRLISQFFPYKRISIILDDHVDEALFQRIGTIESYDYPKVVIQIPQKEAKGKAAQLLDQFPIADITIEEPTLEESIRAMFSKR